MTRAALSPLVGEGRVRGAGLIEALQPGRAGRPVVPAGECRLDKVPHVDAVRLRVPEQVGRDERMRAPRLLAREDGQEDHTAGDQGQAQRRGEGGPARLLQDGQQQCRIGCHR